MRLCAKDARGHCGPRTSDGQKRPGTIWHEYDSEIKKINEALNGDGERTKQARLSMAYRNFTRRAELDLIKATGAFIKAGGRAKTPALRPRVFANKTIRTLEGEESQRSRQWHWAKQKVEDFNCAVKEGSIKKTQELLQAITNNEPQWLGDARLAELLHEAARQLTNE